MADSPIQRLLRAQYSPSPASPPNTPPPANPPPNPSTPPPNMANPQQPPQTPRKQPTRSSRPLSSGLDIAQPRRPFRLPPVYANLPHNPSPQPDTNPDPFTYVKEENIKEIDLRLSVLGIEEPGFRVNVESRDVGLKRRSLGELPRAYKPLQMLVHELDEAACPGDGRGREWFQALGKDVWFKVREFATKYFGEGDLDLDGGENPWGELAGEGGREFVRYSGMVARGGGVEGGWEAVLGERVQREAVVTGVIGRVLEVGVFDRLLFGCGEGVEEMLGMQDRLVIQGEGYERTELRTANIRAILLASDDPHLTENFWPAVDELTIRLLTMLLPLLDVMDAHFPESRKIPLIEINQDLHSVVAEAAYFSLAIRCQPNAIFRFVWPDVGDIWDLQQEQDEEGLEVYNKSKAAAEAIEAAEAAEAADAAERRGADSSDDEGGLPQRSSTVGKVKIVLCPKLETVSRSGRERQGDVGTYTISMNKAQVIYYAGYDGGPKEREEGTPTLEEYMEELREARKTYARKVLDWFRALVWKALDWFRASAWYLFSYARKALDWFRALAWYCFPVGAICLMGLMVGLGLLENDENQTWWTGYLARLRGALGWVLNVVWGRPADLDDDMPWPADDGWESRMRVLRDQM